MRVMVYRVICITSQPSTHILLMHCVYYCAQASTGSYPISMFFISNNNIRQFRLSMAQAEAKHNSKLTLNENAKMKNGFVG